MSELTEKLRAKLAFDVNAFRARFEQVDEKFLGGAMDEHARTAPLIEGLLAVADEAIALLESEDAKNRKNVRMIDGVEYFSIGGNFAKNAAFYALDCQLARLEALVKP